MEYAKRRIWRESNKIIDMILGNNISFDWKADLLIIIISDDGVK